MKQITYGLEHIDQAANLLYDLMPQCRIFTFQGDLGAGKTTLVQQLLRRAGVAEVITSPTFTYVNIYTTPQGQIIYHFDCYRITSAEDFIRFGFHEYLYAPGSWSFIEWPEVIMPLLTHDVCHVSIDYKSPEERVLRCRYGS